MFVVGMVKSDGSRIKSCFHVKLCDLEEVISPKPQFCHLQKWNYWDKYCNDIAICGIKKKLQKWIYIEKSNRPTDIENKLVGGGQEGIN